MPIYEYRCGHCGHEQEHLQKVSADPVAACPQCGGSDYAKQLSVVGGFQLKGGGYYATDFRNRTPPMCPVAEQGGCGGCG